MLHDINRYTPSYGEQWDDFVRSSNNGTLFHLRRFLNYHPPGRHSDHSLILEGPKGTGALFPAALQKQAGDPWLSSHPGATFGGLVTPVGLSFQQSDALVADLIAYARKAGFGGIRLTLPPTIYNRRLSNYTDAALLRHGFTYDQREISSILYLEPTPEANRAKFTNASRRALRKAENGGIEVRYSDDLSSYYAILLRNLKRRHNVQPTHSLVELQRLASLFPEDIRLLAAYLDGRMIAGIVTFATNPEVTLAYYISHDEAYQQYRAMNLLFYRLIEQAIAAGTRYLDFGLFTIAGAPNRGLARFKESFGASGLFRDTLSLSL